jgi:hypothetical protein
MFTFAKVHDKANALLGTYAFPWMLIHQTKACFSKPLPFLAQRLDYDSPVLSVAHLPCSLYKHYNSLSINVIPPPSFSSLRSSPEHRVTIRGNN